MRTKQQKFGDSSENLAVWYLKQNGYKIIEQNYRNRLGEIDIIAYDRQTLVFVEVKTRRSHTCGFPEEAVTPAKQRQLRKIAQGYCALCDFQDIECRFDVISLLYDKRSGFSISHIKNAF